MGLAYNLHRRALCYSVPGFLGVVINSYVVMKRCPAQQPPRAALPPKHLLFTVLFPQLSTLGDCRSATPSSRSAQGPE